MLRFAAALLLSAAVTTDAVHAQAGYEAASGADAPPFPPAAPPGTCGDGDMAWNGAMAAQGLPETCDGLQQWIDHWESFTVDTFCGLKLPTLASHMVYFLMPPWTPYARATLHARPGRVDSARWTLRSACPPRCPRRLLRTRVCGVGARACVLAGRSATRTRA